MECMPLRPSYIYIFGPGLNFKQGEVCVDAASDNCEVSGSRAGFSGRTGMQTRYFSSCSPNELVLAYFGAHYPSLSF